MAAASCSAVSMAATRATATCFNSGAMVMSITGWRRSIRSRARPGYCYAATVWAGQHAGEIGADGKRFAVSGDSAGGNLAAVMSMRVRDEGGPTLCAQLLNCPVADFDMERPSMSPTPTAIS